MGMKRRRLPSIRCSMMARFLIFAKVGLFLASLRAEKTSQESNPHDPTEAKAICASRKRSGRGLLDSMEYDRSERSSQPRFAFVEARRASKDDRTGLCCVSSRADAYRG